MKRCMGCMEEYKEELYICPHCGYEENTLPEEVFHLTPGTIIGQKYQIGKVLGFGGFGVTYIGFDMLLEKKIAIKEYLPSEFATRMQSQTNVSVYSGEKTEQFELGMSKFVEEARKLARFNETAEIVNVYDCIEENNTAYIIMEYLEGESLKEYLEKKKKLSVEEAETIILPILRSLQSVHEAGLIHRDIAPDNIFLTKDGRVKLLDFGAARYASATHSRSLSVIYKPGYAPEEQYQSRGNQGPWTDVYALAATMYKMITGVTPDTSIERRAKDGLKPPSKLGVDISKNKETALLNALNVQVKNRTQNTTKLLEEWESKGNVKRVPDKIKTVDIGKMGNKTKVFMVLAAVVAFVLTIAVFIMGGNEKKPVSKQMQTGMARVPSVINETMESAEKRVIEAGLQLEIIGREYSKEIEKDLVLSQTYKSGILVASNQKMGVVVSGGIRQIYMPDISGKAQVEAIKVLEDIGFKVLIEELYSAVVIGNVVRTSCEVGSVWDEGTTVTIYVSKGIDPATIMEEQKYVVVDFTGKMVEEVRNTLEAEGIYLDPSAKAYSDTIAAGCVISQDIPAGAELKAGSTISVEVSLGKEMVRIPDLIFKEKGVAETELAGLALTVDWQYEYSTVVQEGLVVSQLIEAGQEVDKGTVLMIVISKGPEPTATPTPHVHTWKGATCTSAKTCKECGAQEGSALGHTWKDATCTSAKTCKECGAQEGSALGHIWKDATCTNAKTCKECGAQEGSALGHKYDSDTDAYCNNCNEYRATWHYYDQWNNSSYGDWELYKTESKESTKKETVATYTYLYYRWVDSSNDYRKTGFIPSGYTFNKDLTGSEFSEYIGVTTGGNSKVTKVTNKKYNIKKSAVFYTQVKEEPGDKGWIINGVTYWKEVVGSEEKSTAYTEYHYFFRKFY